MKTKGNKLFKDMKVFD